MNVQPSLVAPHAGQRIEKDDLALQRIVKGERTGFAFLNGDVLIPHHQDSTKNGFCEMVRHRAPGARQTTAHGYATLDFTQRCVGDRIDTLGKSLIHARCSGTVQWPSAERPTPHH